MLFEDLFQNRNWYTGSCQPLRTLCLVETVSLVRCTMTTPLVQGHQKLQNHDIVNHWVHLQFVPSLRFREIAQETWYNLYFFLKEVNL